MEKHNEFHTDVQQGGTMFQITFITNDKNNFLAMQDLARKCVDGEEVLSLETLENRILVLEHDKRMRDTRDKIASLFATMQYGKLLAEPARVAYFKSKLNEIWGATEYTDTDSIHKRYIIDMEKDVFVEKVVQMFLNVPKTEFPEGFTYRPYVLANALYEAGYRYTEEDI